MNDDDFSQCSIADLAGPTPVPLDYYSIGLVSLYLRPANDRTLADNTCQSEPSTREIGPCGRIPPHRSCTSLVAFGSSTGWRAAREVETEESYSCPSVLRQQLHVCAPSLGCGGKASAEGAATACGGEAFHTAIQVPALFDVVPSAVSRGLHLFNINGPW